MCCDTKSLTERIARIGLGKIKIRRIQGRHFLIEIPDMELLELLKQHDWTYLREFFVKIEPWSESLAVKEGGEGEFSIREIETRLSEFFDESSRGYGVKDKKEWELLQERDDTIMSDSKSAMRTRPEKASEDRQNLKDEAINVIILEKTNVNVGC
ncbi:hypothetical protein J1N35_028378 [Gossypium stocksii]|uniref:Uncharacterized protein n=1 Tax=Gossypium stocksii TaxID=47602 RepID=A0A9D3UVT3_9ROSI|nr:hypothetical protein J1N35_028378 [Gossypium stocksii]